MDTQASIQLEESTSIVCVTTSTYKRHPGEVSINDDEVITVILLYIEAFLISKSVSPAELALVKKSTPGLFFRCRSTLATNRTPFYFKFFRLTWVVTIGAASGHLMQNYIQNYYLQVLRLGLRIFSILKQKSFKSSLTLTPHWHNNPSPISCQHHEHCDTWAVYYF